MATSIEYVAGAERPALTIELLDEDGNILDLTGYTGTVRLALDTTTTALTKTGGVTCGTGGVTVTWTTGELALTPGNYIGEVTASNGNRDYIRQITLVIMPALA
jgi:hypothetical protein